MRTHTLALALILLTSGAATAAAQPPGPPAPASTPPAGVDTVDEQALPSLRDWRPLGFVAPPDRASAPGTSAAVLAPAERRGRGLTVEVGLGVALVTSSAGADLSSSGINLAIGGWIGARTALTVRVAGGRAVTGDGQQLSVVVPAVQHFVTPRVFLAGGVGLGQAQANQAVDPDFGLGLDARAGYLVRDRPGYTLAIELEGSATVVAGGGGMLGAQLGWQLR